jgi:O-antigen/teichoic acid export membrane protein
MAAGFVTVCGLWGLGLVLEQILLVSRRSATILRKNLAFSLIKLGALPVALLLVGPEQGIIVATELGVVAGLLATWLPLRHLMTWRWRLMYSGVAEIRTSLAGSALGNQVSALIAGLPNWLLPLIVTERGGAGEAAYFYTSWMIMTLVNTGPSALAVSLLAEGARQGGGSTHLIGKAYRYTGLFMVPATLAVAVGAPYVLPIFGHEYAGNGLELLRYLALAGLPYAVVQINFTKLRLDGKHLCLSGTAALLAAGTLLGSYLLLPAWGLVSVGLSWLGSCLVVAVLSGWFMGRPPAQRRAQT